MRFFRDVVATTGVSLHLWRVVILAERLHLRLPSCSRLDGDILGLCSKAYTCTFRHIHFGTYIYSTLKGLSVFIFRLIKSCQIHSYLPTGYIPTMSGIRLERLVLHHLTLTTSFANLARLEVSSETSGKSFSRYSDGHRPYHYQEAVRRGTSRTIVSTKISSTRTLIYTHLMTISFSSRTFSRLKLPS